MAGEIDVPGSGVTKVNNGQVVRLLQDNEPHCRFVEGTEDGIRYTLNLFSPEINSNKLVSGEWITLRPPNFDILGTIKIRAVHVE